MLKKLLVAGVLMSLVAVMLVAGATTTSAQSMSLCQTVDALVLAGVISADKVDAAKAAAGCSATAAPLSSYTFTRNLTMGSTGADVTALQNTLIGLGYEIPAGATGYFGAQTQAALIAYQTAKGITPAVGYFGPITMASIAQAATPGVGTTPVVCPPGVTCTPVAVACPAGYTCTVTGSTGGALTGTFGTISTISQLSQYSAEEVGAGQDAVKVAGFEVTSSNDGDIELTAMKITFDASGYASGDSTRLVDYIDSVSIMMGSDVVGSADASDFTRDSTGVYSKTIALTGAIVRADDTEKMYIAVDAVSNFDSGDIDSDSWTVAVNNIRYVDGSGVTTTETAALATSGAGDIDTGVSIAYVSFSAAADVELKIAKSSASPQGVINISSSAVTEDAILLKGTIKVEGDSDVWLDELPITLTSTGSSNVDDVTGSVKLTLDGVEYTESVSSSATTTITVTFDNLDTTIAHGDTVNFTISADINDTSGTLDDGDSILASITTTNRAAISAENEEGDSLTDSTEKTGSALGTALGLYETGIALTLKSVTAVISSAADAATEVDQGSFTIKYTVAAYGSDIYVDNNCVEDNSSPYVTSSTSYEVDDGNGGASIDATTCSIATDIDSLDGTYGYYIAEDATRDFTLNVTGTVSTDAYTRIELKSVGWATTDAEGTNGYTFDLDSFVTPKVFMNVF